MTLDEIKEEAETIESVFLGKWRIAVKPSKENPLADFNGTGKAACGVVRDSESIFDFRKRWIKSRKRLKKVADKIKDNNAKV